jgi:hypothetical protein
MPDFWAMRFFLLPLLLFVFSGALLAHPADTSQRKMSRKERKAKRWEKRMKYLGEDPVWVGMEVSKPRFRNGIESRGLWMGPSVTIMGGLFHLNYLRGSAEVFHPDSGKLYRTKGKSFSSGINLPLSSTLHRDLELAPVLGFGISLQEMEDPQQTTLDNANESPIRIGVYFKPGVRAKIGPLIASLDYYLHLGGDWTGRSAFSAFNHYPSMSFQLGCMPILMNAREFSTSGVRHYRDLVGIEKVNSGMSYWKEVDRTPDYIKYRKEQIYWIKSHYADRYQNESIRCNDVKPFTFIGPRFTSNWFANEALDQSAWVGLQAGFRYSSWYMAAFADKGDLAAPAPEKDASLVGLYNNSMATPKLSGAYRNSTRFGVQAGIEWLVWTQKSGFKPHYGMADQVAAMTGFVGLIPFVGYGLVQRGDFRFHSASGASELADYTARSSKTYTPESLAKELRFWQLGAQLHIGAVFLSVNWELYKGAKHLNTSQISAGLNLPVARMIRSLTVKKYRRKIRDMEVE